jgi:cytochrome c peroxidase
MCRSEPDRNAPRRGHVVISLMNLRARVIPAACLLFCFSALDAGSLAFEAGYSSPAEDLPLGLPRMVSVEANPALVAYGEFLFHTPVLSRDHSTACVSCHDPSRAFSGPAPTAIGIGGAIGRRHPPALLNLYAANSLMWDGRAPTLAEQIRLPLESPSEMNIDWPAALRCLRDHEESRAFLKPLGEPNLGRSLVLTALASYVRSLVSGASAFDRYYFQNVETALSEQAKEGLTLFIRRGRCSTCHTLTGYSALLTDNNFHSIGIGFADGRYKDAGRFEVTGRDADRGLFKTPSLRNVALRSYFMHDGSMPTLRGVVEYYNRGGNRGAPNLDERIRPLFMSARDIENLLAFLGSLNSPILSHRPWLRQ